MLVGGGLLKALAVAGGWEGVVKRRLDIKSEEKLEEGRKFKMEADTL